MAQRNVNIVIKARDEASRRFNSIARSAVGMVGAFLSFRAINAIVRDTVAAFNRQELAETKLAAALRATGGAAGYTAEQFKDYADGLQKVTRFGDESILEMQSVLATFRNITGPVFMETTGLALDLSAAFGQDLKSSAIQLGKALNDPATGISALSRVGITFSDVQKEQIKRFTETNQLASAQKVILDELAAQFGGQATAQAQTFGGAIAQLGNAYGDAKEEVGGLAGRSSWLMTQMKVLQTHFENVELSLNMLWTRTGYWLVKAGGGIKFFFQDMWHRAKQAGHNIFTFWKNLATNLQQIMIGVAKKMKNPFAEVEFNFVKLGQGLKYETLLKKTGPLEAALKKELDDLEDEFAGKLARNLNPKAPAIPGGVGGLGGGGADDASPASAALRMGKWSASESRFYAGGGPVQNPASQTAKNTANMRDSLKEIKKQAALQVAELRRIKNSGLAAANFS
jgi:hypothetical protein